MPSEAYGEADPEAILTVEISDVPGAEEVSAGDRVYLQNRYGQQQIVRVTAKEEKTITFDAKHELAGKELDFTSSQKTLSESVRMIRRDADGRMGGQEMLYKEPIQICGRIIQNRIVMPPMATGKAVEGAPGDEMIEYYRQRARGTGLVIVEHEYVMLQGMAHPGQLSMAADPVIPAYRKLTNAIHGEGSAVIAQLNHAGVKAMDTGMPPAGPSAVPTKDGMAEAMDREQIRAVVAAFTAAAVRAKEAGFDGAELHSAHGYLLNQFYSPLTNHRDDEYSVRSMADRTRLHCEIIRAVRAAVGEYFMIAIRFGACDYAEGGSRIEDIPEAVRAFEAAGADLIDISGGVTGFMRPGHTEPGYLKELSIAAKSAVSVPVILTGGVTAAQEMEALLQEGAADLIGVGRALLKDPAWSEKAWRES